MLKSRMRDTSKRTHFFLLEIYTPKIDAVPSAMTYHALNFYFLGEWTRNLAEDNKFCAQITF